MCRYFGTGAPACQQPTHPLAPNASALAGMVLRDARLFVCVLQYSTVKLSTAFPLASKPSQMTRSTRKRE